MTGAEVAKTKTPDSETIRLKRTMTWWPWALFLVVFIAWSTLYTLGLVWIHQDDVRIYAAVSDLRDEVAKNTSKLRAPRFHAGDGGGVARCSGVELAAIEQILLDLEAGEHRELPVILRDVKQCKTDMRDLLIDLEGRQTRLRP